MRLHVPYRATAYDMMFQFYKDLLNVLKLLPNFLDHGITRNRFHRFHKLL